MSAKANELTTPLFWSSVRKRQNEGQRYGQAVFNTAAGLFPAEAERLSGTDLDPFYNDNAVKYFLAAMSNLLSK